MASLIYTSERIRAAARWGWRDAVLFVAFFALLAAALHGAQQMRVPWSPGRPLVIDLSPAALPGYAARSVLRMFLAFGASLAFTLVYGYAAAYNRRLEKLLVLLLDILQSVPVLGFLSVTVTGFMALFPGSLFGLECASIFAIFTGQAWNMTFSFYHSLKILPQELREAAAVYHLTAWQRLVKLEAPFSMIGLVWNGMMSFGGGWFFLAAAEAITVLGHRFTLPGIGSYMAAAIDQGDARAIGWAIGVMIAVVILVDQLFWRPVVAWSQKFKFEQTEAGQEPTSVVLDLLRHSAAVAWTNRRLLVPLARALDRAFRPSARRAGKPRAPAPLRRALLALPALALLILAAYAMARGLTLIWTGLTAREAVHVVALGFLTLLRVVVVVVAATLIWKLRRLR